MNNRHLQEHYSSLRADLDAAYAQTPWVGSRIDELAEKLIVAERLLSVNAPDEQCEEGFPGDPLLVGS